jgi:hypothetical protein
MRSTFLFSIVFLALSQALSLTSNHGSSDIEKHLQSSGLILDIAFNSLRTGHVDQDSRQPPKRDLCGAYQDLITARDNARGRGEQHTEAAKKLVDAFKDSTSFQAIRSIFDKLFDDAKIIVDDAQASDTAHALQGRV